VTRSVRPAAYIRVAAGGGPLAMVTQRIAVCHAARARGLAEPTVYLDVDGEPGGGAGGPHSGTRPALARLAAAVSTGQHDALLISVGTICGLAGDIVTLLASCSRHGVAVECITPRAPVASAASEPAPRLPG
jgi:DNA invertase Pin-like site-specific DNA recombinase